MFIWCVLLIFISFQPIIRKAIVRAISQKLLNIGDKNMNKKRKTRSQTATSILKIYFTHKSKSSSNYLSSDR